MTSGSFPTYWLGQFPSGPNMDDGLNDAITVIMDERKRATLIGYRQGELVVIHQTHLATDKVNRYNRHIIRRMDFKHFNDEINPLSATTPSQQLSSTHSGRNAPSAHQGIELKFSS